VSGPVGERVVSPAGERPAPPLGAEAVLDRMAAGVVVIDPAGCLLKFEYKII